MSSFPAAFCGAIEAKSFGEFKYLPNSKSLWKVNIVPVYVEKSSDIVIDLNTEVATIQVIAND